MITKFQTTQGPAAATDSLHRAVRASLLETAYHDSGYTAGGSSALALLIATASYKKISIPLASGWLATLLIVNAGILLTRHRYFRRAPQKNGTDLWARLFFASHALAGLSWGIGAWIFIAPLAPVDQCGVAAAFVALTAIASRFLDPCPTPNYVYIIFSFIPAWAHFLGLSRAHGFLPSLVGALAIITLSLTAHQQFKKLFQTVKLGLENRALNSALKAAEATEHQLSADLTRALTRKNPREPESMRDHERSRPPEHLQRELFETVENEIRPAIYAINARLHPLRTAELPPGLRGPIDAAATSAETVVHLLNELYPSPSNSADLESRPPQTIPFAPAALAQTIGSLLRPRATQHGLTLDVTIDARVPAVVIADPLRIGEILFHLVTRAIAATQQGRIGIRVSRHPDVSPILNTTQLTFLVENRRDLVSISAPLSERPPAASTDFNADPHCSGELDPRLTRSEQLVASMNSHLETTTVPTIGSIIYFNLTLPQLEPTPPKLAPKSPIPAAPENRPETPAAIIPTLLSNTQPKTASSALTGPLSGRVLVVEDDRVNQRVITHFLKKMGLEVGLAEDGHAAIATGLKKDWHLIIMDCQLPGVDGLEVTRQIRAQQPDRNLPIIALTANATTEDREACFAAGMNDFLTKPLRAEVLAAALRKWLPPSTPKH